MTTWMVADLSNPERQYSMLDNWFEPEFGPFPDKATAEEFASQREPYWACSWPPERA